MAYMNQERKAKIVAAMKPIMAKYGVKGTFKCSQYAITFKITSGKVDFIGDMNVDLAVKENLRRHGAFDVNPYWVDMNYSGVSQAFLNEAVTALKAADWYDRSDAMTDYFDTAYYYHIEVGKWNKPYVLAA